MQTAKITARAHTNIALIKYWGKKDEKLIIPQNSSLSLTLDHFYTDTTVQFDENLTKDHFSLNGKDCEATKVSAFLDLVRQKSGLDLPARVISVNHVPTMAGLASSASAYAALALAASTAAGLKLNKTELSRLARRGSGSACRSIYGGFVEWQKGHDDQSSFAKPFIEAPTWDIKMIAIVINAAKKKISSRFGMQHVVQTSPYYPAWVESTEQDLALIKDAILQKDFVKMGTLAEKSAMKMHALNLSADPHFNYFEPESLEAMQAVEQLRADGIACYYTMDAGPNVKVICQGQDLEMILAKLKQHFRAEQLLVSAPGPGATLLERN